MRYGSTTEATDFTPHDWKVRLVRIALWFVPRANPDFEPLFPHIQRWLLEIDESGRVQREIALGIDGAPLFAAPDDRNFGFWADSDKTFLMSELAPVSASEFEQLWQSAGGSAQQSAQEGRAERPRAS